LQTVAFEHEIVGRILDIIPTPLRVKSSPKYRHLCLFGFL